MINIVVIEGLILLFYYPNCFHVSFKLLVFNNQIPFTNEDFRTFVQEFSLWFLPLLVNHLYIF